MKKLVLSVTLLITLVIGQSACGVLVPTCESLLESICRRKAECSSPDINTQEQYVSSCVRNLSPETTCRYMTSQQKAEFENVTRNGCHDQVRNSVCSGGGFDTGPTCNSVLGNFLTAMSR